MSRADPLALAARSAVAALPRRAAEHAPFLVVLAAGAALRGLAIAAVRPAIFFYGDSFGYLLNAGVLVPHVTRPVGYPIFLRALGAQNGHLLRLVVVQHLIGLALGVALYALLRRLRIGRWAALLGAAPVLLDAYQINIEHQVMAEALVAALMVAALFALLWRDRPSPAACAAGGLAIALATLTRSAALALIVPAVGLVAIKRLGWVRLAALLAAFAVPLLGYAGWFSKEHGSFALGKFDGHFLYGLVAPFVQCSSLDVPAYERVLCDARPPAERPSADFYVWDSGSPIRAVQPPLGTSLDGVLRDFSLRVVMQQPGSYLRTAGGIFVHFLRPGRSVGRLDFNVAPWQFSLQRFDRVRTHRATLALGPPFTDPVLKAGPVSALASYQRYGYTWGPLLAALIALGAAGAFASRDPRARAAAAFLTAGAVLVLAIPSFTVMFDYRYGLPALLLAPPAGAVGLQGVLRRWAESTAPARSPREGLAARWRRRMMRALIPAALRSGATLDLDATGLRALVPAGASHREAVVSVDLFATPDVPFAPGSFDVVTAAGLLGRFDDRACADLLRSVRRALRPGGRLVLTIAPAWTRGLLQAVGAHQVGARSPRAVRDVLERAGFDPPDVRSGTFEAGFNVWGVAVKRPGGSGIAARRDPVEPRHAEAGG